MENFNADPVLICRGVFVLAALTDITVNSIPPLQQRFLDYGPRQCNPKTSSEQLQTQPKSTFTSALDYLASIRLPHSWFIHFYVLSVLSSVFWAYQITTRGQIFQLLAAQPDTSHETMTINQVILSWVFMMLHGCRRLYECITLHKPSESKIPIPGWVVGVAFYLGMGVVIWVEGIPAIIASKSPIDGIVFAKPSGKTILAVPLYIVATGIQHDCHVYLASLKKYTLPEHPFFQHILCPHYTSDCAIYLALAIVAAPGSQFLNKTICTALFFSMVNLGITSESSRIWYGQKFGKDRIAARWRMVPLIY